MKIANIDFETFGTAGYIFDGRKWQSVSKSPPHGLGAVGASAYSEHPDTEILSLGYDIAGRENIWIPSMPPPGDLFAHIASGGLVYAWNSLFEYFIWNNVAVPQLGWPPLHLGQTRDTMARSYAWSLPGKLAEACKVLGTSAQKDSDGQRLLGKFSMPRNPTKVNQSLRNRTEDHPEDAARLYSYNIDDVRTEKEISSLIPELSEFELHVWLLDQKINVRGVQIDKKALQHLKNIVLETYEKYEFELQEITGGIAESGSQVAVLLAWLASRGTHLSDLRADTVSKALENPILPPDCRRVLELRQALSMSSVKKLFAIERRLSLDGRLRGLFQYQGGDRTGRWAGRGPQPQNLPRGSIDGWSHERAEAILNGGFPESDPLAHVSGCLRGLFCAKDGHDLICGDFSAIEAVVLAELAGESWRQKVFRTHGKIYETSASKISGIPLEEFEKYKLEHGKDHPLRKMGKVAELASGYAGWIGAWKRFGADTHFPDDRSIKEAILSWRRESPAIVEMWGGQLREDPPGSYSFRREFYGLEGAAVQALLYPGTPFHFRSISYMVKDNILYCLLPSGRYLSYHNPRLYDTIDRYSGQSIYGIKFYGWNSDYKIGPIGWIEFETYGGKLAENVVQAVARDLLAYAMLCVESGGYPIVLDVHDEIASEVPVGFGSEEEFASLMSMRPKWAADWPIRVATWRGNRYRKD